MDSSVLFQKIGRWRTQYLWRAFGLCVYLSFLHSLGKLSLIRDFEIIPWSVYASFLTAFLLMLWGARPVTLILSIFSLYAYLIPVLREHVWLQVSEEFIIMMVLPVMSLLLFCVTQKQGETTSDESQVALFRWGAVLVMGFAFLHKFNSDFILSEASCGRQLPADLVAWWKLGVSMETLKLNPWIAVIGEGAIPFLLATLPNIGMLFSFVFLGVIGHVGPAPFTLIVMVMCSAFVRDDAGKVIADFFKRHWLSVITLCIFVSGISYWLYQGPQHWHEYHIFQMAVLLGILSAVAALRSPKKLGRRAWFPSSKAATVILLIFIAANLINGVAPYLGLKYRLSFAMLSNLRADHSRWNSYVFPKSMYLFEHDPFVRVKSVEASSETLKQIDAIENPLVHGLFPGMFSPMSFVHRLKNVKELSLNPGLRVEYQGQEYYFKNVFDNQDFMAWLDQLSINKWFQEWLILEGEQVCVH